MFIASVIYPSLAIVLIVFSSCAMEAVCFSCQIPFHCNQGFSIPPTSCVTIPRRRTPIFTSLYRSEMTASRLHVQQAEEMKSSFIETDLRNAAMRLHTKEQAPREGKALSVKTEPYIPTIQDYLQFLVDSKHVYEALEVAVNRRSELAPLRCTGLERAIPLEQDILFITQEYGISRPSVGDMGKQYSSKIQDITADGSNVPEFICHYYNFYFAHLAGGRMIGKKMSSLLLKGKTLEFYKVCNELREKPFRCTIAPQSQQFLNQCSPFPPSYSRVCYFC